MTRSSRLYATLLFAAAFALPAPVQGGDVIMVSNCFGGMSPISIPGKSGAPGQGDDQCCKFACHAGSDRRKKSDTSPDDGCC